MRHRNKTALFSYGSRIIILMMLLIASSACTPDITMSMVESNPPSFRFERNWAHVDRVLVFLVQEIATENSTVPYLKQSYAKNKTMWVIEPIEPDNGIIKRLPTIIYGEVPTGFTQIVPQTGHAPPLEEGKIYEAGGPYVMMNLARVRFVIRDGKPEQISIPGLK